MRVKAIIRVSAISLYRPDEAPSGDYPRIDEESPGFEGYLVRLFEELKLCTLD